MDGFLTLKGGEIDVGGAPEVISVLPMGRVRSQKGDFQVDEESFEAMRAQLAQRGVDLVVDYEHQTLTGEEAPAAGWVKELFLRDGHIQARVAWTPRARTYLENREYRYLSPVITVRKPDRKAMGLHSLALTNTPAIAGMNPIVNSSTFEGGNNMDFLKELASLLGLGEDAAEADILEALKACLAENKSLKENAAGAQPPEDGKVVANKAVCELLGLKAGAATADVTAAIMALKGGVIDGVNVVAELQALKRQNAEREAGEAVSLALRAGKITPAQKEWAKSYALDNPQGFAAFVEKAPQLVPLGELAGGELQAHKAPAVDGAVLLVCKQMGLTEEDVRKYGMEEDQ